MTDRPPVDREDLTPLSVRLSSPALMRRAERRARKARAEYREVLARSVLLVLVLVGLMLAEIVMELNGSPEGARRFDVGLALALAAFLDSVRVTARKAADLKEEGL